MARSRYHSQLDGWCREAFTPFAPPPRVAEECIDSSRDSTMATVADASPGRATKTYHLSQDDGNLPLLAKEMAQNIRRSRQAIHDDKAGLGMGGAFAGHCLRLYPTNYS